MVINFGDLTIAGNGSLWAKENDCFAVDVRDGANLTIENGTFVGNISVVYVLEGTVTINGGTYLIQQQGPNGFDLTLGCDDENYDEGIANIEIRGGAFYGYNPEDGFVADGYKSTLMEGQSQIFIFDFRRSKKDV